MILAGFDIESTGLNEPDHRIIEVAVIRYEWDGVRAVELDTYEQRIDPERNIEAKAQAVHGITASDLVGKPKWSAVAPVLSAHLGTCDIVVGHNSMAFDFDFVIREWERVGTPLPDFEPFDTMLEGRWATPWGKSPSLEELCFSCGVPYDHSLAHAAEYDVRQMMECLFYGVKRGTFVLPQITRQAVA